MPKKPSFSIEQNQDWDDIFDSIEMSYVPLEYVSKIIIKFSDETSWDIDIDNSRKQQPMHQIEDSLDTLFQEYDDLIETVDFKLDLDRIKHDLSKRVLKFLKLNR